jgi:hypothetical protein
MATNEPAFETIGAGNGQSSVFITDITFFSQLVEVVAPCPYEHSASRFYCNVDNDCVIDAFKERRQVKNGKLVLLPAFPPDILCVRSRISKKMKIYRNRFEPSGVLVGHASINRRVCCRRGGDAGGQDMASLHDVITDSFSRPVERRRHDRRSAASTGAIPSYRKRVSDRLAMIGVALGYLGLVAVLALAPMWQQTISPYQHQPLACTDFGGSR